MTKSRMMLVTLPFAGFYDSIWSQATDFEEERHIEYMATCDDPDNSEAECNYHKDIRLSERELGEIYRACTSYRAANMHIARAYVPAFSDYWSEALGYPLRLEFESMTSPREYNFETDRIFAHIPVSVVRRMFAESKRNGHKTLQAMIAERFTSRSGFHIFYSNRLETWLDKPLAVWDHNEVGTLLLAVLQNAAPKDSDWEGRIYDGLSEGSVIYDAWSDAVDWRKVAKRCEDARQDKLNELGETDPDLAAEIGGTVYPIRCPKTPDLFNWAGVADYQAAR